ncbi:AMP-binding protein [Rhodococcus koreensis]
MIAPTFTLDGLCPLTTHHALHRAATIGPDVEAIVTARERVTFRELAANAAAVTRALNAHGVRKGDHVAVCLGNGARWVEIFLAVTALGAVVVPVNTRFRADEMAHVLNQSRSSLLITADAFLRVDFIGMLRQIAPGVDAPFSAGDLPELPDLGAVVVVGNNIPAGARQWEDFLAGGAHLPDLRPAAEPDDVALIQYTSGTTSFPKGVLLTHRSLCANGFFSGGRLGLRLADRFHSARPFFHVAGSSLSVLACIQHVCTLVTMDRFEPGETLRLFEEERCTHFSGNDTIALMILGHPDVHTRRLHLRGAWVAATSSIVRQVIDVLGATECVVGYGLSEASPNVAQSCWWEPEEVRVSTAMRIEPGVEVRISSLPDGGALPAGERGEIQVRGWNVMHGYFDLPEQTRSAIDDDGWLHTGDVGYLDDSGRLVFTGRTKELIRVGGENVAPAEVEDILHKHPAIGQAVVVGVPDPRLIEVPFAFIQLTVDSHLDQEEVTQWCKQHMAGFKIPRHLHIVTDFESIGMTASGKVRKTDAVAVANKILAADPVAEATR